MKKTVNICLSSLALFVVCACSTASDIAAPQSSYVGIPADLMARCIVNDVALDTVADLVVSRQRWKEGHERCAARIDQIRKFDAEMRQAAKDGAE